MKRIGILTFHYPENMNYGAILQAYALMKILLNMKQDVKIINYKPDVSKKLEKFNIEGKAFKRFSDKFLKLTKLYKKSDLKNINEEFDIFIVGSDQVWRAGRLRFHPEYFFSFVEKDKKKISYAASFGLDHWKGHFLATYIIKKLIKKFDYISVREKSGINICKDIFNVKAEWVLDPTLMLEKKEYQLILNDYKDKNHLKKSYAAYVILDDSEEFQQYGKKIANKLNLDLKFIDGEKIFKNNKQWIVHNEISQWLTYLKDADLVITDSFHCTVFSLIFHRNFIVIANKRRGTARLESLLSMVGLEDRLIKDGNSNIEKIINKKINYKEVDEKIKKEREKSFLFLKKALGVN